MTTRRLRRSCTDMRRCYILNADGTVTKVSTEAWSRWFEKADRHIGNYYRDGYRVSTVFLGLDHNWGEGPPHIFETMMFDDTKHVATLGDRLIRLNGEELTMERYSTKDDAMIGHERHVQHLNKMIDAAQAGMKLTEGTKATRE